MRLKMVFGLAAAAGAAGFVATGLYQHFVATQVREARISQPAASQADGHHAFVMHKAPQPIPELTFVDGEGRERTLAAFRGRTVLLNIWATWCVPCREEMPSLDRLQARLGGADFAVVPLSIDRKGLPAVKAFYKELGLTALGIYVDKSGRASQRLRALGIPTTLLVDPEGREVGRLVGPAAWDSADMVALLRRHLRQAKAANAK